MVKFKMPSANANRTKIVASASAVIAPAPVVVPLSPPVPLPAPVTCSTCAFFLGAPESVCRRFPPLPWQDSWLEHGMVRTKRSVLFTTVSENGWCGEHRVSLTIAKA